MMVKLNLTFLNNPRKHTTGYIPYKNLEEWNDDALYNESFFQSVSVNSSGQLEGLNKKVLSDEELNITTIYAAPEVRET